MSPTPLHVAVCLSILAILASFTGALDRSAGAQTLKRSSVESRGDGLSQEHAHLSEMAGAYSLRSRLWFSPNSEPVVTNLAARRLMGLQGRVLQLDVEGSSESDYPFEGRGFTGFDRALGSHWYIWMDTTSTGVATLYGTLATDGTGHLNGRVTNRQPDNSTPLRIEIRREGNSEIHDYYSPDASGIEWRWMELTYLRAE